MKYFHIFDAFRERKKREGEMNQLLNNANRPIKIRVNRADERERKRDWSQKETQIT